MVGSVKKEEIVLFECVKSSNEWMLIVVGEKKKMGEEAEECFLKKRWLRMFTGKSLHGKEHATSWH